MVHKIQIVYFLGYNFTYVYICIHTDIYLLIYFYEEKKEEKERKGEKERGEEGVRKKRKKYTKMAIISG